jgi:hypothetical protein
MATQYSITLTIPQATVAQLVAGGYWLHGFKAVKSASPGGAPVVWFATQNFLESNLLTWSEQYEAYLSESTPLGPGVQINASTSCAIDLQQQVTASPLGLGTPEESASAGISIINGSNIPFNCGLMLQQPSGIGSSGGNAPTPLCAFSLPPTMTDEMLPMEQVVMMFATNENKSGSVLEQSTSWAVVVDLTANNSMSVTYDLSQPGGWVKAPSVAPQEPPVNLLPLVVPGGSGGQ